jgi:tetratricopeptide (TPR) repeat protein
MVGRDTELQTLLDRLTLAEADSRCELVTVLGSAGVGKSRLIHEFLQRVGDNAVVFRGHCLPYGDGITFWALSTALSSAASISPQETQESARAKVDALVGAGNADVGARLATLMGLSEDTFSLQESFWAARRFFEDRAVGKPVVVVFDDIHWAEPTFLDLIEHVCDTATAPVLIVCPSRHELLEARPGWAADRANASHISLEPLSAAEGEQVVENLLGTSGVPRAVQERLTRTAEGNPLFVEQTLSMLIDGGVLQQSNGQWILTGDLSKIEIPPTISALITARLDGLAPEERTVTERASVIGQSFYLGAVQELIPEAVRSAVPQALLSLQAKELVAPDRTTFEGEEGWAFRHILIRDSAYAGLLKRTRAELHERFVEWLQRITGARSVEYEEIIGYHLAQATHYRRELGPLDAHGREVAARACGHLGSAGRRALVRRDMPAATNLLERAVSILDERDPDRLELIPDLAEALIDSGEFAKADEYLEQAIDASWESGDERLRADALVVRMFGQYSTDPEGWSEVVVGIAEDAIAVLARHEDHCALSKAWRLLGSVHGLGCQYGKAEDAVRQAVAEARLAGDRRQELQSLPTYALSAAYGPTPVPEAIERCRQILAECEGSRSAQALVLCALSHLEGLAGRFEDARLHYRNSRAIYDELGMKVHAALVSLDSAPVELLAGEPAAAERELRLDYEALAALGDKSYLPTTAALLAQALHEMGRDDEAEHFTEVSQETSFPDDLNSEVEWRCARAKILAAKGAFDEAAALAAEAVEQASRSDFLEVQGNAHLDLAEVMALAGRAVDATAAAETALRLFAQKQSTAAVERARKRLAVLGVTHGDGA